MREALGSSAAQGRMKPLSVASRVAALVAILLLSYYIGRPVYWGFMGRFVEGYDRVPDHFVPSPIATGQRSDQPLAREPKKSFDVENGPKNEPKQGENEAKQGKNPKQEKHEPKQGKNEAEQGKISPKKEKPKDPNRFSSYNVLQRPIWEVPPAGTQVPPLKAFSLSKEMIKFRAKKNVIIVTFANHAFQDFVLTWVRHLTNVGVTNLLVGAMDEKLTVDLFWKGVPVFDMGSGMNPADVGWGTPIFHKMGREKVYLINAILGMGFEVLFCDTDMVWLKDPLPYMERYPDADILVSSDSVVASVEDDSLENFRESFGALNIGIFHWRPTEEAKKFAAAWKTQLEDESIWDQNGFNDLIQKEPRLPVSENDTGLFYAYDNTLKVGILPISIFCSGHTYFVQGLYKQLGLEAYAVHATYQFAGTEGKRHRFREAQLFYDTPDYYSAPGGFISFNASIPEELLRGGNHTVETHFALVNYQMKQVRDALAIATVLNRTLVMPPMWCRFDRLWFGHPGILHHTRTPQPFLCPMDHVFENMFKSFPEEEFGPKIDFREYSFLENPRVPLEVKTSKLLVKPCNGGDCSSSSSDGVLELERNSTDKQLRSKLLKFKDVSIIHFSSMQNMFGGFTDEDKRMKFRRRVQRLTGIWCCLENIRIGHIYYDMYWDEKPNWKPLPPSGPENDHPPIDP